MLRRWLFVLALLTSWSARSHACAPAPPRGAEVQIAAEEALIVWDPAKKLQHFIRRADFRTDAKSFGFLVPVPSLPELAEAPDSIFDQLADRIRPEERTEYDRSVTVGSWFMLTARSSAPAPVAAGVSVLASARVAGFDAKVLSADSADALGEWLKEHDYPFDPALREWLAPYVDARWKIVAFQVARDSEGNTVEGFGTRAVRLSFQSERPFFPYREPSTQRRTAPSGARLLRIYLVSPTKLRGKLAAPGGFPGKLVWGAPFEDAAHRLAQAGVALPAGAWLTTFEDESTPRPGVADVFFEPDPDVTAVYPPPIVHRIDDPIVIPIEGLALLTILIGAGAGIALLATSRRRRAQSSGQE